MPHLADEEVKDTQEVFESISASWGANVKRTYDDFQEISLTSARRSQSHFDDLNGLFKQALTNAIVTQDNLAKTMVGVLQTGATLNQQNIGPITQEVAQGSVYPPNRGIDVSAEGVASANQSLADAVANLMNALTAVIVTSSGGASTPSQTEAKPV